VTWWLWDWPGSVGGPALLLRPGLSRTLLLGTSVNRTPQPPEVRRNRSKRFPGTEQGHCGAPRGWWRLALFPYGARVGNRPGSARVAMDAVELPGAEHHERL
jgi:hypothetical protein